MSTKFCNEDGYDIVPMQMISTIHIEGETQETQDLSKAQKVFSDLYYDATDEFEEQSDTSDDLGWSEKKHVRAKLLLKGVEEKFFNFPNQKPRRQNDRSTLTRRYPFNIKKNASETLKQIKKETQPKSRKKDDNSSMTRIERRKKYQELKKTLKELYTTEMKTTEEENNDIMSVPSHYKKDEEEVKLRAFPLVLKDSAKNWFQNLEPGRKTNWETVKETFLSKYGGLDNPEHLWHRISSLHQATSRTYLTYESQFLRLWAEWEASLAEGERAPNFLKKEKFLAGRFPDLQEKVKGKFPETFEEALQIARVKDRKLEYQAHTSRVEHPQGPTMADERLPPAPTTTPEDPHLELLQRVTNQLDNLSINMVQGVRQQQPQPNNERMPNGPRRQPQRRDYFCYNCGEEGHGMYFCPHPRNFNAQAGRGRQQVTPPRARPPPQIQPQILQNPQMVAQPQVLQRSEAPQPVAEIPPLLNNNGERAVNVISIEGKGKAKMIEPCVMPIKKARMSKEANLRRDTMETEDEAGTSHTGTVWRTGLTLHICGIRFQRGSTLNDKKAIQLACHLGLVNTVRLIPYLIEVYDDKPSWGVARTISRLSRWAHCLIRSVVPRTIPIVLEEEDKDIVKAQRVSADWYDRYEKKYNLLQPKPLCDEDGWLL
ncbi:hypothetical protein L7F22_038127 [Adiantum nelumboides]|nr:hypothetical protein [Adiantum nelumboides]